VGGVTVVSVTVGSVTVVAVSVMSVMAVSVMSVVNAAVATVNKTVVVKIFLETALSMSAAVLLSEASAISMGAGWCCVMIVLEVALSVSAAIMAEIVMKIMITVVGFVEVTTVSVVVLGSVLGRSVRGSVSVVVLETALSISAVVGTAVGSESTLVVEVSKLIELGSAGEEVISARVSEAIDIVHNALTLCVISGSIKNFVV
jgi:hypothetical protein